MKKLTSNEGNYQNTLSGKNIVLIISGGIAAYKSLELIRILRKAGAKVRCILTKGGAEFVTPLSVMALSGDNVFSDMFSLHEEKEIGHIKLAREADLIITAPATANLIARMAYGFADDLATTVLLATDKKIMIAPAMNVVMWKNKVVQENVSILQKRGVEIIGPGKGSLACGEEGEGRMAEPDEIFSAIEKHFVSSKALAGKRILVTSGPTYEPLDPVRFIGNRSSGKQGHAIAVELAKYGAEVVLITGPVNLPDPAGVKTVHVDTAREMLSACQSEGKFDVAVCAAAVADWRPRVEAREKMKKGKTQPVIHLEENPDILATLSKAGKNRPRLVIGFAAETGEAILRAKEKFKRKGCDWIVANEVGNGKAFGKDENEVALLRRDSQGRISVEHWPMQSKEKIAGMLVDEIIKAISKK